MKHLWLVSIVCCIAMVIFMTPGSVFAGYTSDLTGEGTASASESMGDGPSSNAFDDNTSTYWRACDVYWEGYNYLRIDFGSGNEKTIRRYRIRTSTGCSVDHPEDWDFEASNSPGGPWTDLDTRSNQGLSDGTWYTYDFSNPTAYRYYQIHVTETQGGDMFGCLRIAEMEMMEWSADVTFTNGANAALNYQQTSPSPPQDNWHFGQFSLAGDATGATLNSVAVTLGGTYDAGDLGSNPFRLYASNTNDFGTASAIGSDVADPGSGNDVTFSSLSDAIPSGTRFYWVTADISGSATVDDNINGTIDASGDLSITGGTLSGSSNYGKLNAGSDTSLPVELSSFTATTSDGQITLRWVTQTEVNNVGFGIYRSEAKDGNYDKISFVSGAGNTAMPRDYQFVDKEAEAGKPYFYYLEDIDIAGEKSKSDIIKVVVPPARFVPGAFRLLQNYPNPFNPEMWIPFDLATDANVTIRIYDVKGQLVRQLNLSEQKAGSYLGKENAAYWNGKDQLGQSVSSGLYFYMLKAGSFVATRRMVILK